MRIYVWYPIFVSLGLGFTFMNIPPLNQEFMAVLGTGYDGLSWFLSGLIWSHALCQLPAGLIADRASAWATLVGGLAICILANILPFLAPHSLALATGLRFFLGVGTSLAFLSTLKVLLVLAPPNELTTIQGWQGAGFSFGFVLPYLTLPHLGENAWPFTYLLAIALLVPALAAAFFLPRARLTPPSDPRPAREVKKAVLSILTSKPIWCLGLFHGLSYGSLINLGNWLPSIMADLDGLGRDPAVWSLAAVVVLLVGTFGRAFGGHLSARLSRGRLVNGAVALIAVLYIAMGLAGGGYAVLGSALLMALACGSTYGGIFTLSASVGGAYAATAMGVMNMIGNLCSVALTLVFGYVRQYAGEFGLSLLASGLLSLAVWMLGRRIIKRADDDAKI